MAKKRSKKILGFDGIRGLAVISVVLTHVGAFSFLWDSPYLREGVLPLINGPTGVQAFFVLSGFLITMLLIKEHRANNRISLRNFYYRRTLRIIPLYLLFLAAVIVIHLLAENVTSWISLLFASTYTYNFVPYGWHSNILGHTWSLAVEEHFYLVWPVIFSFAYAKRGRGLLWGLAAFVVLSFASRLVIAEIWWLENPYNVDRWSFIAGSNIALGCICAVVIYGDYDIKWRQILASNYTFAGGALLYMNSLMLGSHHLSTYLRGIGIALMIAWICLNQKSLLVRWLEFKPLSYIGIISYGVYIYQGLFFGTGPHRMPDQAWPPDIWIGLILLVVVAPLSYHYFEKPFLRLKSNYSSTDRNRPEAESGERKKQVRRAAGLAK